MSAASADSGAVARSWLFVPGNRPERFAKAMASGADAVILDLEDAVAPADKLAAREAVAAWLSPDRPVYLRINAPDTEWFASDLDLVGHPGVAGVVLPKAEFAEVLAQVAVRLAPAAVLLPLVETAFGIARAETLAAQPRVLRLMFGSIDFQLDLGIDGEGEELAFFRSKLVLASRLSGAQPPIDGVTTAIRDLDRLQAHTRRARRMGFGGKLCIHPDQVATVNRAFAPSDDELAWARKVVEAAGAADGGAVAVDGKMVDRPVLLKAQRMIAEAARRAQLTT